jgi:hypothetical protein
MRRFGSHVVLAAALAGLGCAGAGRARGAQGSAPWRELSTSSSRSGWSCS